MPELDGPGLYRALEQHASAAMPAVHFPDGGYPEPRGPGLFGAERRATADQTLHRGGGPARHCARAAGHVSAALGAVQQTRPSGQREVPTRWDSLPLDFPPILTFPRQGMQTLRRCL